MALYISNRQATHIQQDNQPYMPVLLDVENCNFKHRIFSPYYKFSKIIMDTYEICNRKSREIVYPLLPTGSMTLVFILGKHTTAEIWGCNSTIQQLHIPISATVYCIRLKPGAFRCFSDSSASDITDCIVPLENYFSDTSRLILRLKLGESFHERNVIIQRFLETIQARKFKSVKKIQDCLQFMHDYKGIAKVTDLSQALGCSSRYIDRLFLENIGISPKIYCQILQLHVSLKIILSTRPKSLLQTAIACGYFDQAHMNRSYRRFLECTAYDMKSFGHNDMSQQEVVATDTNVPRSLHINQFLCSMKSP